MNSPDPMPRDFGWRYIGWLAWTNALTVINTLQAIFATLALMSDVFSHNAIKIYMVSSAVLSVVIAQIKRNVPPPPPPTKLPTVQPSEQSK